MHPSGRNAYNMCVFRETSEIFFRLENFDDAPVPLRLGDVVDFGNRRYNNSIIY